MSAVFQTCTYSTQTNAHVKTAAKCQCSIQINSRETHRPEARCHGTENLNQSWALSVRCSPFFSLHKIKIKEGGWDACESVLCFWRGILAGNEQRAPSKARLHNQCTLGSMKGLSMSGLKMPTHSRFHTLILLEPMSSMFLYLFDVSLRWNIRLVARLFTISYYNLI